MDRDKDRKPEIKSVLRDGVGRDINSTFPLPFDLASWGRMDLSNCHWAEFRAMTFCC